MTATSSQKTNPQKAALENPYTEDEIQDRLENDPAGPLSKWAYEDGHLTRSYQTGSWRVTMLTANAIAFLAEAADHHPDLLLSYPKVQVRLMSHDVNGISERDFELAATIEETVTWLPEQNPRIAKRDNWLK